ncbi:MAG: adenylate kinase [Opitutaceae bacterium]|jgi:adenylate kinase
MAIPAINGPFSHIGTDAYSKFLLLGSFGVASDLSDRARSLHIEHVSSESLTGREISRTPRANLRAEAATLATLRRWFFARKPDAGFILTGFPATLLQAKVFDEWLDARDETLDGVLEFPGAPDALAAHYRTLGLLQSP